MPVKPNAPYPELDAHVEKIIGNAAFFYNVGNKVVAEGGGRVVTVCFAANWVDAYVVAQVMEKLRVNSLAPLGMVELRKN